MAEPTELFRVRFTIGRFAEFAGSGFNCCHGVIMYFLLSRYRKFSASTLLLFMMLLMAPVVALAECKEFTIVEYEDRVEAVCVGEPLTAEQKQALAAEEKRQEQEYKRKKAEEDRRLKDAEVAEAKRKSQAEAERKKLETKPLPAAQKTDTNKFNIRSF
jgi:hypothetical protein